MIKIRFEPAKIDCEVEIDDEIMDITDDFPDTDVPYACRSASCGACRVYVREGQEAFNPASDEEKDILKMFDEKDIRLACQLKIEKEVEQIVLEVVEPG